MDEDQARRLGGVLRERRLELGLTTRRLGTMAKTTDTTVVRLEQGAYLSPRPENLGRLAHALGLNLADLYAIADYPIPNLPGPLNYLQTKFGADLDDHEMAELTAAVTRVLKKHGIDPLLGSVERSRDDPTTAARQPRKRRSQT